MRSDKIFPLLFTVVTTCACVIVAKWYFFRILRLIGRALLHSRGVRVIMLRRFNGSQVTLSPAISFNEVKTINISRVVKNGNSENQLVAITAAGCSHGRNGRWGIS